MIVATVIKLVKVSMAVSLLVAFMSFIIATGLDGGYALAIFRNLKRDLADYRLVQMYEIRPCPTSALVIAALGQSNAGNHIEGRIRRSNDLDAYVFFRGKCYLAEDPLPGSSGDDGSLWTLLAQRLSRDRQQPVVIVPGGLAGSVAADWTDPSLPFIASVVRRLKDASSTGLPIDIILWLQGESDSEKGTPGDVYRAQLAEVIAGLGVSVDNASLSKPQWIVFRATRCGGDATVDEGIRAAQTGLADQSAGIFAGPDTDALAAPFRRDGCHFNASGRDAIIEMLAPLIDRIAPRASEIGLRWNVVYL